MEYRFENSQILKLVASVKYIVVNEDITIVDFTFEEPDQFPKSWWKGICHQRKVFYLTKNSSIFIEDASTHITCVKVD